MLLTSPLGELVFEHFLTDRGKHFSSLHLSRLGGTTSRFVGKSGASASFKSRARRGWGKTKWKGTSDPAKSCSGTDAKGLFEGLVSGQLWKRDSPFLGWDQKILTLAMRMEVF